MSDNQELDVWPEEIRLADEGRKLTVSFENGEKYEYTAEFLRVTSPSAEVQGHHPSQRKTVPGKKNVKITKIEPSGNYWDYFLEVGRNMDALWQDYLQRLEKEGLKREP